MHPATQEIAVRESNEDADAIDGRNGNQNVQAIRRCRIQKTTFKDAAECIQCGTVYGPQSHLSLCRQCNKVRCHACYTKVQTRHKHDECIPKTDEQARHAEQVKTTHRNHPSKAIETTRARGTSYYSKLPGKEPKKERKPKNTQGEQSDDDEREGTLQILDKKMWKTGPTYSSEARCPRTGGNVYALRTEDYVPTGDRAEEWWKHKRRQRTLLAKEVEQAGPTMGIVASLPPPVWQRIAHQVILAMQEYCDAYLADTPDEEEIEAASLWLWVIVVAIAHPTLKHAKQTTTEDVSDTVIKPIEDGPFSTLVKNRLKLVEIGRRSEVIRDLLQHTREWDKYREWKESRSVPAPDAKIKADIIIKTFKANGHKRAATQLDALPSPVADKQLLQDMQQLTAMETTDEETPRPLR